MKYIYLGDCAAGFVQFSRPNEVPVVMAYGQPVEVPDWLDKKLATNSHFEQVTDTKPVEDQKAPGECPDCGQAVKVKKNGDLYKHKCVGD